MEGMCQGCGQIIPLGKWATVDVRQGKPGYCAITGKKEQVRLAMPVSGTF